MIKKAASTLIQNGVVLHNRKEYLGPTGHKQLGTYGHPKVSCGLIALQDHGNPMHFRNIWIRNLGEYDKP